MLEKLPQVSPLNPKKWDKRLKQVIRDTKGAPINVHQLMAHNPTLLTAWWSFRNHSIRGGTLGKRLGELVILRVAVHMQAWYEWASHVDRALACGLSIDDIQRVLNHDLTKGWQSADASLLKAVDELINSHSLSKKTQTQLAENFSVAQVMDIMAIQGMYVILACMIKTWGLTLDQEVQNRIAQQANDYDFMLAAQKFSADNKSAFWSQ